MNLLEVLRKEILVRNITDKKNIQDYLYNRTGEIFSYDPLIVFCTSEERTELCKIRMDIRNIKSFTINCFTWAYLFVDLLNCFGIPAKVKIVNKDTKRAHAYVESYINNEVYLLDLMTNYEDITRIKYGFATIFNLNLTNSVQNKKNDTFSNQKAACLEDFIEKLKQKLITLNITDPEKSTYIIFKYFEKIMNSPIWENRNIDYFSGIQFLSKMIFALFGQEKRPYNTHFINKEEQRYIEVYTIVVNEKNYYFAYQNENGNYKLNEVDESFVIALEENFTYVPGYNLSKKKR